MPTDFPIEHDVMKYVSCRPRNLVRSDMINSYGMTTI